MLPPKKRRGHAGGDGRGDEKEPVIIDFAWVLYIGLELGYRERDIGYMYYGKWCDLFEQFKFMHNIRMRRGTFEEPKKEVSLLDL